MCTNHPQQLFLPEPALLTRQEHTEPPLRAREMEAELSLLSFEQGWAGGAPPAHLLPPSLAQPSPAGCAAGHTPVPRAGWDSPSSGWEQVVRPGLLPVPGLQEDTEPLFAPAQCGRLPQLGSRRLVLFKRLLFSPCVFGKTRGEPGRGMGTTLAGVCAAVGTSPAAVPAMTSFPRAVLQTPDPTELLQIFLGSHLSLVSFPDLSQQERSLLHQEQLLGQNKHTKVFSKDFSSLGLAWASQLLLWWPSTGQNPLPSSLWSCGMSQQS